MSLQLASGWEKELPPVPMEDAENILKPKSLKRKNVKNLSFCSNAQASQMANVQPLTLARKRPPPLLNLTQTNGTSRSPVTQELGLSLLSLQLSEPLGPQVARPPHGAKRQTVISSYSPTKSVSSQEFGPSSLPTTPLTSPTSSSNLKDKDLVHLKELGAGNYGAVLKVFHVPLQRTMARKVVNIDSKLNTQTQIIRELRIMHECRSQYIVEFYGAYLHSNTSVVLCMEYCNCGSIDKIASLLYNKAFPLPVLKVLLFSMLSGLNYLYETHKIIHRDIKPSNVLMTHKGEFKLCDFGVSRELTNSVALADTFVGTSTYMSPERIQGNLYSIKSDMWSMGLMLFELASGLSPWLDLEAEDAIAVRATKVEGPEGILDLLQRIVNEPSPSLLQRKCKFTKERFDVDMCQFIDKCLIKDEHQRPAPQDLLLEPFVTDVPEGIHSREVKAWAKMIRKQLKEDN